jgi:hypothetical protein
VRFRKEPDFGKNDKILRQALKVGPDANDYVGFAVNLTRGALYLDLNQNLDLTDDPRSVYRAEKVGTLSPPIAYFRGVRLTLNKDGAARSYLLEPFYYLGEGMNAIYVRSSFGNEIELQGRKWQFQVVDNLDGQWSAQDSFLLTPIPRNAEPKAIAYRPMPVAKNLFVGGHHYQLGFAFGASAGDPPLAVTFTESSPPMAELTLDAQFVRRLVLQGDGRLVIVDSPSHTLSLPADKYRIQGVYLQAAPDKPVLASTPVTSSFALAAGAPSRLNVGAPLVSSVAAERKGSTLLLRYILKGAAGEEYVVMNPDKSNPPKFVIYKGDREIAKDSFKYG